MKPEGEIKKLNERLDKAGKEVLLINRELVLLKADYKLLKNVVDKYKEFSEDQERNNRKIFSEMNEIIRVQEKLDKRISRLESSKD